jgi:tRNA pseudouridine38-40 synthase
VWHIPYPLDIERIRECCSLLVGRHDFSAFRSTGSGIRNTIRNMLKAEVNAKTAQLVIFEFEADGFLRHMVRNIVGTLVDVGIGKMSVDEFQEVFTSLDRKKAGMKAPPQGLFLMGVRY